VCSGNEIPTWMSRQIADDACLYVDRRAHASILLPSGTPSQAGVIGGRKSSLRAGDTSRPSNIERRSPHSSNHLGRSESALKRDGNQAARPGHDTAAGPVRPTTEEQALVGSPGTRGQQARPQGDVRSLRVVCRLLPRGCGEAAGGRSLGEVPGRELPAGASLCCMGNSLKLIPLAVSQPLDHESLSPRWRECVPKARNAPRQGSSPPQNKHASGFVGFRSSVLAAKRLKIAAPHAFPRSGLPGSRGTFFGWVKDRAMLDLSVQ
jgi:hypothetical protein